MTARLRVDPVACNGVGLCAHLAPDLVTLDSWGYPLLSPRPLSAGSQRQAVRAVQGCPRKALFLESSAPRVIGG